MSTELRSFLHSQDREYRWASWRTSGEARPPIPGIPSHRPPRSRAPACWPTMPARLCSPRGSRDAAIDRLVDDFIAEDRGEATDRFIDWAIPIPNR
jgi:hypothetical protein